jgi:hypothetical protein
MPLLKTVLLCNAICRGFTNRRRVCSNVERMTSVDQVDRMKVQEMVTNGQQCERTARMTDIALEMEVDVGNGVWNGGSEMLGESRQGWLVVAGVLHVCSTAKLSLHCEHTIQILMKPNHVLSISYADTTVS